MTEDRLSHLKKCLDGQCAELDGVIDLARKMPTDQPTVDQLKLALSIGSLCKTSEPGEVVEVDPSAAFELLFENLGLDIVAAIESQTEAIEVAIAECCAELLASIDGIADLLADGINVTATQDGDWTVTVDNPEIPPASITALAEAIADALDGLSVNIENEPLDINITGQDGVITVELDPDTLAALEEINVNINNQPIEVTGTVTIDEITGTIDVNWDGLQDALNGLEVETGLEDFLSNNTLSVTLNDEELNINFDAVLDALASIEEVIENTVRKDWEKLDACILDGNGDRVPLTGVFVERAYDNTGALVGTPMAVLSQISPTGTWSSYSLQAGDSVGECPTVSQGKQCWQQKFIEGGLDNTFTRFTHTNQVFKVGFSDESTNSFSIASATGWSNQVTQMADGLSGIMPWAAQVGPFCTTGCGGLPAPVVDLAAMVARYVGFRVCPGQVVPVSVEYTSDQQKEPKQLVLQYKETDIIYWDRCYDCGDQGIWTNLATGDLQTEMPICCIPCGNEWPAVPVTACKFFPPVTGCDSGTDPAVAVTRIYSDCGQGVVFDDFIDDGDGGLDPYELIGVFVDCATGDVVEPPEPELEPTLETCISGGLTRYELVIGQGNETIGEGGLLINICGNEYTVPEGTVFNNLASAFAAWVTANTPYTGYFANDITGVEVPFGCSGVSIKPGDDPVVPFNRNDKNDEPGTTQIGQHVALTDCSLAAFEAMFQGLCDKLEEMNANLTLILGDADDECPCESGCDQYNADYEFNGTEIDGEFSSNSTTLKWAIGSSDNAGLIAFTNQVRACIDAGGTATIKHYDGNNDEFEFIATGYDGTVALGDQSIFTGTGVVTGAGKLTVANAVCKCEADDGGGDDGGDPIGDQVTCASRKLGADFNSASAGQATHTLDSLYDTNGPIIDWSGTFTVTDSANNTHVFTDGQTVSGLASGPTVSVAFTGWIHWADGADEYRCPVNDKLISANFTVQ